MNKIHPIICKILSGRFLLTISAAICFILLVVTLCTLLIKKAVEIDVAQIILLVTNLALIIQNVFSNYFNKKRDIENGNGSEQ